MTSDNFDIAIIGSGIAGGALAAAVTAAEQGRDATVEMVARRGRAQYVEGGGKGEIDPGAVSLTMILALLAKTGGAT